MATSSATPGAPGLEEAGKTLPWGLHREHRPAHTLTFDKIYPPTSGVGARLQRGSPEPSPST